MADQKIVAGMKIIENEIVLKVVPDDFINHPANKDKFTCSVSYAEQQLSLGNLKVVGKEKTFRIIREYSSYSRKKGTTTKRHILVKGLPSFQSAIDFILNEHPKAIIKDGVAINVGGILYPTRLYIN